MGLSFCICPVGYLKGGTFLSLIDGLKEGLVFCACPCLGFVQGLYFFAFFFCNAAVKPCFFVFHLCEIADAAGLFFVPD